MLDYQQQDFTRSGERYDLILDVRTTRSPFAYTRALETGGRYVSVGGTLTGLLRIPLFSRWIEWSREKSVKLLLLEANRGLAEMADLLESGTIAPVVDGPYPLEEIPEAMQRFADGQQFGRIAITCRDSSA